jgi:hypothetical protein
MGGQERRLFERIPLTEAFYCYAVDGTRLDAHSQDISSGGIFLKTEDELSEGAPIALVFKKDPSRTSPIYLTGKIVRCTEKPTKGVGVEWVRAVSNGSENELTRFLEDVLHIRNPQISVESVPGQENPRVEFTFPRVAIFGEADVRNFHEDEEEDTADISDDLRKERKAKVDAREKNAEMPAQPAPAFNRSRDEGALTRQIKAGELRAIAEVKAVMDIAGKRVNVLITHLGTTGMFVRTMLPPREQVKRADIKFELRVRGGMATVQCRCKVLAVDDGRTTRTPGIDLEIARLDEGGNDGVLRAYVRWLTFRNLAPASE